MIYISEIVRFYGIPFSVNRDRGPPFTSQHFSPLKKVIVLGLILAQHFFPRWMVW